MLKIGDESIDFTLTDTKGRRMAAFRTAGKDRCSIVLSRVTKQ